MSFLFYFFSLFLLIFLLILILVLCILNNSYPRGVFFGCLTNKEFKKLTDNIFNDPDFKFDVFRAYGAGFNVWISNGLYFFDIDGERNFSFFQKRYFFKKLKKFKRKKILDRERVFKDKVSKILTEKK